MDLLNPTQGDKIVSLYLYPVLAVGRAMGAAPGSGWEEGEFEFKLVFEEDPPRQSQGPSPVRTVEPETSVPGDESEVALLNLDPSNSSSLG